MRVEKIGTDVVEGIERKWIKLVGADVGTGCMINDEYAITSNGVVLNSDGCPMTESDWETIAVRNSID